MRKLSARQIDWLQSIGRDRLAADKLFEQAMIFYTNRIGEIHKQDEDLWEEMRTVFGLEPDKKYRITNIENEIHVVEVDQEGKK